MDDLIKDIRTNGELVKMARSNLDQDNWDYLTGGSESETTLLRNRQSIDSIAFRPRVMRNVSNIDTTTELLDMTLKIPLFLAPIGSLHAAVSRRMTPTTSTSPTTKAGAALTSAHSRKSSG